MDEMNRFIQTYYLKISSSWISKLSPFSAHILFRLTVPRGNDIENASKLK